ERDALRAFLAQQVEEGVEARRRSMLRDVEQAAAAVIDLVDQREVLVALLPAELVDADAPNAVEASVLQAPSDGVLHGAEHGVPAGAEPTRRLLPGQHLRPARQEPDVGVRRRR